MKTSFYLGCGLPVVVKLFAGQVDQVDQVVVAEEVGDS